MKLLLATVVALSLAARSPDAQLGGIPAGLAGTSDLGGVCYRSDKLAVHVETRLGDRSVRVRRRERAESGDAWDTSSRTFSTSYQVTGLSATNGGSVVFVSGLTDSGADLIEKWVFEYPSGRVASIPGPLASPVTRGGGLQPIPTATQTGFLAPGPSLSYDPDDYVPPAHRGDIPPPTRVVVFEPGHSVGFIKNLVLDPEQRFLLLQTAYDGAVYRVDLPGTTFPISADPETFVPVFGPIGAGALPILAEPDVVLSLFELESEGRLLMMVRGSGYKEGAIHAVVQVDSDNDGNWDSASQFNFGDWFASYYRTDPVFTFPDTNASLSEVP